MSKPISNMTVDRVEWSSRMVLGGRLPVFCDASGVPAVFLADGKHQIVVLEHLVRVYYLATRQCVRTVDVDALGVRAVALDAAAPSQVLLFTEKGDVVAVNWREKVANPVAKIASLAPPQGLVVVSATCDAERYVAVFREGERGSAVVAVVARNESAAASGPAAKKDGETDTPTPPQTQLSIPDASVFAWSHDRSQLVFVAGSEAVVVALNDPHLATTRLPLGQKSPVTVVAVSGDGVVALGTATGPVQLLYPGQADQRLLKWHIDQVKALAFSPDNTYLLSGGLEKVLVLWHLDSDNHTFLPRLNGTVSAIHIDPKKPDLYTLLLAHQDQHELLTLLAVDLVSRLAVSPARPRPLPLAHTLRRAAKKIAAAGPRADLRTLPLRHDYALPAAVHPTSTHLYLPSGAAIQTYDWSRQEQVAVHNAAAVVPTGKVRSETKLVDPQVALVAFTADGSWMVTVDTVAASLVDNLLSKSDEVHALKFWKQTDQKSELARWELACKIIDPHGPGKRVCSLKAGKNPVLLVVSADERGAVRTWRPQKNTHSAQQTAWALHRGSSGSVASSTAVDVCFSADSSALFVAHDTAVSVLDDQKLAVAAVLSGIADSPIRALEVVANTLIVLTQTRLGAYDLIQGRFSYLVRGNFSENSRHLLAVDHDAGLFCVAANYYDTQEAPHAAKKSKSPQKYKPSLAVRAKLLVFSPTSIDPVYARDHPQGITSVVSTQGSFLFVDLDARIGIVTASQTEYAVPNDDIKPDVNQIMIRAEERALQQQANNTTRVFDSNTFSAAFQNPASLTLDSLFERVVSITGR